MKCKHVIVIVLTVLSLKAHAQAIDNTVSYKNITADRYFRFNYENDVFSATDKYYTQGLHIELVAPWIKRFPLAKILVHPASFSYTRYGIGIEHNAYTPSSIGKDFILYNDHPFGASLFLKTFVVAVDTIKARRFSTSLSTGLLGPGAGGKEMQETIHRALNNFFPHGWQFQIANDAVLNYQVDYEQQLLHYGHYFSLSADAIARAGTLSDKASIGFTTQFGYFDSPFGKLLASGEEFRIYAYDRPQLDVVGYDAMLQGGVFNHDSPYTIDSKDIERIVLQNRFGFVVQYRKVYLEYFQSVMGRDFKQGNYHVWGGVQIAVGL